MLSVLRCRFAQSLLPIGQVRIRWYPAATEAAGHPQGARCVASSVGPRDQLRLALGGPVSYAVYVAVKLAVRLRKAGAGTWERGAR